MIGPKTIITLKKAKDTFEKTHPKFAAMFGSLISGNMIDEGTIIELTVTRPDGTHVKGNMKVQPSDMEFFRELSQLGM